MGKRDRLWLLAMGSVVWAGCGGPREAAAPEPAEHAPSAARAASAEPPPEPPGEPPEEEPPPEAGAADSEPPEEPEPEVPTVAEVCEALCKRADELCTKESARRCRGNCLTYEKQSAGCEDQVRAALQCQAKAEKSDICGHVAAASCHGDFRALRACQKGEAPPPKPVSKAAAVPAGWQRVNDDELDVSVVMPPGAALDPDAKRRTWRAEEGGITYYVASIPVPRRKLTQQTLIRVVINYVGFVCQRRLKVYGRYESKGKTVLRYDTGCNDGSEWHGILLIGDDKAVSIGFHGPSGAEGVRAPFFYSFEYSEKKEGDGS